MYTGAPGKEILTRKDDNSVSRRTFFSRVSDGLHGAALAYLLGGDLFSSNPALAATRNRVNDLRPRNPHFEPKATSVIQFFMNGGPSQVDLFDPKPALTKYAGQPPGRDLANDIEFINEAGVLCRLLSNSPGTGNRGSRFPRCCLTLPIMWTTSP